MTQHIIDARKLACPAPVLKAKEAVDKQKLTELTIIVDNEAAKENVTRFLSLQNFYVTAENLGSDYRLLARREGIAPEQNSAPSAPMASPIEQKQKIMILAATDRLGFGDEELGKKLMISFIKTIKEMGSELWRLVFVNNGVKLTTEGSPVLPDLLAYEQDGLTILVCGTCLSHFNLLDAKRVGITTNMLDIVTAMQLADKVIRI